MSGTVFIWPVSEERWDAEKAHSSAQRKSHECSVPKLRWVGRQGLLQNFEFVTTCCAFSQRPIHLQRPAIANSQRRVAFRAPAEMVKRSPASDQLVAVVLYRTATSGRDWDTLRSWDRVKVGVGSFRQTVGH